VAVSAPRIGLLAPFKELPGEISDVFAAAREPISHWQVITAAVDSHDMGDLAITGADAALLAGVERMRRWRPTVVAWACTSGSFYAGRARAVEQARRLEVAAGVPVTSTSLAFVEALAALGVGAVSVVGPYPEPATHAFAEFLGEWGIRVERSAHLDCAAAATSELLDGGDVDAALRQVGTDVPILLPDTAVWGIEIQRELASELPVPLLVANQVTLWQAFDLAGASTELDAFGTLRGVRATGVTRAEMTD
jgi:maleate cis-trans isomerase